MTAPTTVLQLIGRVHRAVRSYQSGRYLLLSAASLSSSATTVPLSSATGAPAAGSVICVGTELMLVTAVSGANLTVVRGFMGTTAATQAASSVVEVGHRWYSAHVLDALREEIQSWPENVYVEDTVTITLGGNDVAINAAVDPKYRYLLRSILHPDAQNEAPRDIGVRVYPTTETGYASGWALDLGRYRGSTGNLEVVYAADFTLTNIDTTSTTLATIGVSGSLIDAWVYGASSRLLLEAETPRSAIVSQPEPRTAEDVAMMGAARHGALLGERRDQRIAEEAARLRIRHPWRFKIR